MAKTFFLTIFITVASVIGISAQTIESSVLGAKDKFSDIKNRSNELERMRREADTPVRSENHEIRFPEIKEDFEQIQLINGDVLQPQAALSNPDLQAVYQAASEIKKRALRLHSNLFTTDTKKKFKIKAGNADDNAPVFDLKTGANELDIAIATFVKSSMFQNIQVVNSEDSQRAQKELENIVKLSAAIERQSARHANNK
jgi:hypothetical protein